MKTQFSPVDGWFYGLAIAVFLVFAYQAFQVRFHAGYCLEISCLAVILCGIRLGQLLGGWRGAAYGGLGMLLFLFFIFLPFLNASREF